MRRRSRRMRSRRMRRRRRIFKRFNVDRVLHLNSPLP
jgi:hypothetical protein